MGLPFGQLEPDRQAEGIDQGVYLGRQAAARATHEGGIGRLFFGVGRVLVDADRRRVDHLDIALVSR